MCGRVRAPTSPEAQKAVLTCALWCWFCQYRSVSYSAQQRWGAATGLPWAESCLRVKWSRCFRESPKDDLCRGLAPPPPVSSELLHSSCRALWAPTVLCGSKLHNYSMCDSLLHFICLPVCSLAASWALHPDIELCVCHHTVLFLGSSSSPSVISKMLIAGWLF